MANTTIKNAPLIINISGSEKIPVSDGSNLPKAVTINLIINSNKNYINSETFSTELAKKLNTIDDLENIRELANNAVLPDAIRDMETKTNAANIYLVKGNYALKEEVDKLSGEVFAEYPNSVYAVRADGSLCTVEKADTSCIAVALIQGPHKFMIEKNGENNAVYNSNSSFYWQKNSTDLSLTNYTKADGTNSYGYLGGTSTPQLSRDYTTWTSGALSDFNGKANTEVIVAASADARDMGTVLKNFNAADDQNQGYSDWYIPACGQLALMYLNMSDINTALTKIGGVNISSGYNYWSSSEYDDNIGWIVDFYSGNVINHYKDLDYRVRFVRDLALLSLKESIPTKVSLLENDIPYVEEAPNDNSMYVRLNSNWTALDLTDTLSYGIKWLKDATSPICTRIGNPLLHKELPIQSLYRGCVYDFKTNTFKYWLDPNDWSKKEDGTASVLDGTDGDVCVHTPKFYGKSGEIDGYYWVRISTIQVDSSWIEIPEMYVGAYRSTVDRTDSLARSIINTSTLYRGGNNDSSYDTYLSTDEFRTMLGKPATNIARSSMRTYCRNSSSEMLSYEQYKWIFYWAYAIEYANFNCQAAYNSELTSDGYRQGGLGDGVTTWSDTLWNYYNYYNPVTPCGYGNSIGNFTGLKTISIPAQTGRDGSTAISAKTFNMPRWRGFDNPFGDIWTNLDGIIIQGKTDSSGNPSYKEVYTTTNVSNYGDTAEYMSKMKLAGIEIYLAGYILEFDLRDTAEIIPSKNGGNTTIGKCDYHYVLDSSTTYTNLRTLQVGGSAYGGGRAGFGCFDSYYGVGVAWRTVGFRLVKTIE